MKKKSKNKMNTATAVSAGKKATIVDVARHAGVSITTAYKAINDKPGINAKTKARVEQLAAHLNYRPNMVARSLRNRKTNIIGVLISFDLECRWYASLADRLIGKFREKGYNVLLSLADPNDPDSEKKNADLMIGGQAEGVIAGPIWRRSRLEPYRDLIGHGPPAVFFGSSEDIPVCSVDIDYVDGVRQIVDYLVACGHRRIGYICGHDEPAIANTRAYGLQKAMLEAGLRLRPDDVMKGRGSYESGYETMREYLRQHGDDLPTALFCHSDVSAISAIKVAKEQGLSVPQDISIVGHDGIREGLYCDPSLTTVGSVLDALTTALRDNLLKKIADPGHMAQEFIKPKLIIRDSVADINT